MRRSRRCIGAGGWGRCSCRHCTASRCALGGVLVQAPPGSMQAALLASSHRFPCPAHADPGQGADPAAQPAAAVADSAAAAAFPPLPRAGGEGAGGGGGGTGVGGAGCRQDRSGGRSSAGSCDFAPPAACAHRSLLRRHRVARQDKALRQLVFRHVTSDIKNSNKNGRNERLNRAVQNFMYRCAGGSRPGEGEEPGERRSAAWTV